MKVVTREFRDFAVMSETPISHSFQYLEDRIRPLRIVSGETGTLPYELAIRIYAESVARMNEGDEQRKIFMDMMAYSVTAPIVQDLRMKTWPLVYKIPSDLVSLEYFSSTVGNLQSVVKGAFVTIETKQDALNVPVMRECCYYIPHRVKLINGHKATVSPYGERISVIYKRSAELYGYENVKHIYVTSNDESPHDKAWYPIYIHGNEILDSGVHEPVVQSEVRSSIKYRSREADPSLFVAPDLARLIHSMSGTWPVIHILGYMSVYRYRRSKQLKGRILTGTRLRFYQLVEKVAKQNSINHPKVTNFLARYGSSIKHGEWPNLNDPFEEPSLIWDVGVITGIFGKTSDEDPCREFYMTEECNEAIGRVAFSSDIVAAAAKRADIASDYMPLAGPDNMTYCNYSLMDYTGFDSKMKYALVRDVLMFPNTKSNFLDIIMPK